MADAFEVSQLLAGLSSERHDFAEFFRTETLSLTIARWPAGSVDDQQPHTEDEVYYVISGRAVLRVADGRVPVTAGSVVFVAAGVEHRFEEISETLDVLVFWSPARHSRR
jgi:mannose-6-phosphate isomerase-like protein (cupin superfamily)